MELIRTCLVLLLAVAVAINGKSIGRQYVYLDYQRASDDATTPTYTSSAPSLLDSNDLSATDEESSPATATATATAEMPWPSASELEDESAANALLSVPSMPMSSAEPEEDEEPDEWESYGDEPAAAIHAYVYYLSPGGDDYGDDDGKDSQDYDYESSAETPTTPTAATSPTSPTTPTTTDSAEDS